MACSYPERTPLTQLKHAKNAILKLYCAIKLGQVVVIDAHQLKHEDTEERDKCLTSDK